MLSKNLHGCWNSLTKIPSSKWHRMVCNCVLIAGLGLTSMSFVWQHAGGQEVNRDVSEVAKKVDQIANGNPAPKLMKISHPNLPDRIPLFPANYDWTEESRVLEALSKLHKDTTKELWEELVRKANDPRYSLTLADNGGRPVTWTVGNFCKDLAYSRLTNVFQRHMPSKDDDDRGRQVHLDMGFDGVDLATWRKARMEKTLYQLQIEVGEQALMRLPKVERLSRDQKDSVRKLIESEIEKLKKTKEPVYLKSNAAGLDTYTEEQANYIRKTLNQNDK